MKKNGVKVSYCVWVFLLLLFDKQIFLTTQICFDNKQLLSFKTLDY
jgi:hypothetical protein